MYLPHKYVNLFLGHTLTPCLALEVVTATVVADGAEVPCALLLDWLCMACTHGLVNGAAMDASPLARPALNAPIADKHLLWHWYDFVTRDLPTLDPNVMQHGVQHIAAMIGNLATETWLTRKEAAVARQAQENRTVLACFRQNTTHLLCYCNVQTVDQLPPIWDKIAWTDKVHVPATIQQAMEAASLDVTGHDCEFQVTTSLSTKIVTLAWRSLDVDDLANGLTPFLLAPRAPHKCTEQQWQVDISSIVYSGMTATLADAIRLLADNNAWVPLDWVQAKTALYNFVVLFYGLIGPDHPLVEVLQGMMQQFEDVKPNLNCLQPPLHVSHMDLPTLALRWVQVRISNWLKRPYLAPGLVEIPHLAELFQRIKINDPSWIPLMPPRFLPSVQLGLPSSIAAGSVPALMAATHSVAPPSCRLSRLPQPQAPESG